MEPDYHRDLNQSLKKQVAQELLFLLRPQLFDVVEVMVADVAFPGFSSANVVAVASVDVAAVSSDDIVAAVLDVAAVLEVAAYKKDAHCHLHRSLHILCLPRVFHFAIHKPQRIHLN